MKYIARTSLTSALVLAGKTREILERAMIDDWQLISSSSSTASTIEHSTQSWLKWRRYSQAWKWGQQDRDNRDNSWCYHVHCLLARFPNWVPPHASRWKVAHPRLVADYCLYWHVCRLWCWKDCRGPQRWCTSPINCPLDDTDQVSSSGSPTPMLCLAPLSVFWWSRNHS